MKRLLVQHTSRPTLCSKRSAPADAHLHQYGGWGECAGQGVGMHTFVCNIPIVDVRVVEIDLHESRNGSQMSVPP